MCARRSPNGISTDAPRGAKAVRAPIRNEAVSITLESDKLQTTILPKAGGGQGSLKVRHRNRWIDVAQCAAEDAAAGDPLASLVMAPWVTRQDNCVVMHDGEIFPLEHPHDPKYGLHAWTRWWHVAPKEFTTWAASLSCTSVNQHGYVYPSHYQHDLGYEVFGENLHVTSRITNIGESDMPVSHGWHPFFKKDPFETGHAPRLQFKASGYYEANGDAVPTGRLVSVDDKHVFDSETTLVPGHDECYKWPGGKVRLHWPGSNITLVLDHPRGCKFLHVWYPSDDTDVFAIEPVTAPANALSGKLTGVNIPVLKPKEISELVVKMYFLGLEP